ncbi:hypothetical protein RISK_005613 [Rhodopirellula islandica]|uniref:Uncharacterized protein n=1 Tax=Rhodopirellula islandica TaxID=595434 RepID=A0A0J1B733_RHOIS|nr:hypothetical protein RISK_005613 [Rhodopirellula islandica]
MFIMLSTGFESLCHQAFLRVVRVPQSIRIVRWSGNEPPDT